VLGQLSFDVVGQASAMLGDEAPGLSLHAALMRARDGRKNAPKDAPKNAPQNAPARARWRAPRRTHRSAAQIRILTQVKIGAQVKIAVV
jgi:hypothetical protein